MMDALADVLKTIRLSANTYFCEDFRSPWGMNIDAPADSGSGSFHVVVKGECWLKIADEPDLLQLEQGDIAAFPTGGAHWLSDTPTSERQPAADVVESILHGANPFNNHSQPEKHTQASVSRLLCGSFFYDSSVNHPFLKDLPCFIHIKASDTPELPQLKYLVAALANESRFPSPGSTAMIDRLTEVLFIQLMRVHTDKAPEKMRYMSALADAKVGAALNLIHAKSDISWTVERLADSVAVSRTAFTEKFSKLVGVPPKTYLLSWSMQKAKTQLQTTAKPMIEIAEASGYSSEAAFNKAFKQFFDETPGRVRRRLRSV
ncbi:MAG: AraC family transcriptional regulator [Pseudomonadales bacterium]